ncbi:MAG TPA: response regulator [Ktedonobacterales bacterium]|jgi:CheY-like chemotaxis protein
MSDVIIVDDHSEIVSILTQLLDSEGYIVRAFGDARRALESAREAPPGLAIVDLMMPLMNGAELIARLRAEVDPNLPIIAMSASSNAAQARALNVQRFIEKPFDLDDVVRQVEDVAGPVLTRNMP